MDCAPGSSILMSVLVFPPAELALALCWSGQRLAGLTVLASVATAELVSAWTGAVARIKWPNDVRVEGRKIAGILVERALVPPAPAASHQGGKTLRGGGVVIGIGLNVNVDLDVFPADLRGRVTSLCQIGDSREIDRSDLARDLIIRLDHLYEKTIECGAGALSDSWRSRSEHLGKVVRVNTSGGQLVGRLVDLDLDCGLTVDLGRAGSDGSETRQLALGSVLSMEE